MVPAKKVLLNHEYGCAANDSFYVREGEEKDSGSLVPVAGGCHPSRPVGSVSAGREEKNQHNMGICEAE